MGFFGGDNEPDSRSNDLIDKQMADNEVEIEQKRRNLYNTRLQVIKAQGALDWSGKPNATGQQPLSAGRTGYAGNGGGWGAAMANEGQNLQAELNKPLPKNQ